MFLKSFLPWSAFLLLNVNAAAINVPDDDPLDGLIASILPINLENDTTAHLTPLDKRQNFKNAQYKCHPDGPQWKVAEVGSIMAGVQHLVDPKLAQEKPSNGPNGCGRVSCSNNAGIWWCNTNAKSSLTIDSFTLVAAGAQYIVEKCGYWDYGTSRQVVSGWTYPDPNWAVVVAHASC
ncbi:conserved hypothetical protein [Talaromyces stipitatus ATCC 10500]|uniref:Secreted protein n=1 Tax=Talaromyces stipitatus (strain ATCC 10500 / CBS 375.48 / QM 6759 / NRRL 1006) TaxID=441959 RepID=B8M3J7_TALSN|nr:uncharacterized protein TSTA_096180 [Talaromyces stipitatus ATCC 10500]EED22369.1 conserved hypothetical protein [Talaromyces stipitatus ATCC 10500]